MTAQALPNTYISIVPLVSLEIIKISTLGRKPQQSGYNSLSN